MGNIDFILISITIFSTFFTTVPGLPMPANYEIDTLLTIKDDWGKPAALGDWISTSDRFDHCKWTGISCKQGHVTALTFKHSYIGSPIPSSICNLIWLRRLDVSHNNITGPFPTHLYKCSSLEFLDLSGNQFHGPLPGDINNLPLKLEYFAISGNNFTGNVPTAIGNLQNLKTLDLSCNGFTGRLPTAIGKLQNLKTLLMGNNPLDKGSIPGELGMLRGIKILSMKGLNLIGNIPAVFSELKDIEVLDLSYNQLDGALPSWLWTHKMLGILLLNSNRFSGSIGQNVTARLFEIDLSSNMLNGHLPDAIGELRDLQFLNLSSNMLNGSIPSSVGFMPNISFIHLDNNMFSGSLPPHLGMHSPLMELSANDNLISGFIPEKLCQNKVLTKISLSRNRLSGKFPNDLAICDTLQEISASNNNLIGEFSENIWKLPVLSILKLENNNLSGVLPPQISSSIQHINIKNNKFWGAIPVSAFALTFLSAEGNHFEQGLPGDMSGLANITVMLLQGNSVTGLIPPSILSLERVSVINMSRNRLTGAIPRNLGLLPMLNTLDLSENGLIGNIPEELNNGHLRYLNVSFNNLTGTVPDFLDSEYFRYSFLGNVGLCAKSSSMLFLPSCSSHQRHPSTVLIVGVTASCFIVILLLGLAWFFFLHKRKKIGQEEGWSITLLNHDLKITVEEIVENLIPDNIIGKGGSGDVYRIQLKTRHGSGRERGTVAVKKIVNNLDPTQDYGQQFLAEVKSLGSVRHGNIVQLFCYIFKAEILLLVYEYLENGDLKQWLHHPEGLTLDWASRLNIAVDIARALSYMHCHIEKPLIHRDIKSSNILLDSNFKAKLGDFGLARNIAQAGNPEFSRVCGTLGFRSPDIQVSEKMDVFSFGVVLLQLTTGLDSMHSNSLALWSRGLIQNGVPIEEHLDSHILDASSEENIKKMFLLGIACTKFEAPLRPDIQEVLWQLQELQQDHVDKEMGVGPTNQHDCSETSFSGSLIGELPQSMHEFISQLN